MTKQELWKIYSKRNPSFDSKEGNVTMTAKGLRKLFETTWDTAFYDGELEEDPANSDKSGLEHLKKILGMR